MVKSRKRRLAVLGVILGAGTVFQYLPSGCSQYFLAEGASAFNWCTVFNCTGGTYFNLCQPFQLLLDCPGVTTATNTTTTT